MGHGARSPGQHGEDGPPDDGDGQADAHADAVHHPARGHLHESISPEEGAEDQPHGGGIDTQFGTDAMGGDGEIGAADIADGIGEKAQPDEQPAYSRHVSPNSYYMERRLYGGSPRDNHRAGRGSGRQQAGFKAGRSG